jgi:selenium donor protein
LTKPLGTGIMSTALKNRLISEEDFAEVSGSMCGLNKTAAGLMLALRAHACTDITGFGLIGHASHLIQEGEIGMELDFNSLPVFSGALEFLKKKVAPGGLGRNRDFYSPLVEFKGSISQYKRDLLFDPQTSGGLLVALPPQAAEKMVKSLHNAGISSAVIIGRVIHHPQRKIIVK